MLLGSDIAPFDCGAVTNALVNAAWSRGLGCVINSQGIMQSPVVREHARIPDDQVIMICVARAGGRSGDRALWGCTGYSPGWVLGGLSVPGGRVCPPTFFAKYVLIAAIMAKLCAGLF